MRESGYYPDGTEFDPAAPWNQEDELGRYEVTVVVTVEATDEDEASDKALRHLHLDENLDLVDVKLIELVT